MGVWQGRSRRKRTGGRLRPIRKKRRFEIGRELQQATLGPGTVKPYRTRGGSQRIRILTVEMANVYDPATKASKVTKIVTVRENPANPNFVQRNIITKGAILETELGLVRVRSRPGQDGVVNAVRIGERTASK
ncbi:MAG: 30S ribosomal protein S8e [Thermoplasmata archaeon]|nr:30S ribosomal protein S8e [Thermoplasmata archaeon]MCI4361689.1 30S ribosomal protein S8e [Thermoplasmata archaeon]